MTISDSFGNADTMLDIVTTTNIDILANLIATDTTLHEISLEQICFNNCDALKLVLEAINKNCSINRLTIDNLLILCDTNNPMLNILKSNKFLSELEIHIHTVSENDKLVDYLTNNTTLKSIYVNYSLEQDLWDYLCQKNQSLCDLFNALCTNSTLTSLQIHFSNHRYFFKNENFFVQMEKFLKTNKSLLHLIMEGGIINVEHAKRIASGLKNNSTLKTFIIPFMPEAYEFSTDTKMLIEESILEALTCNNTLSKVMIYNNNSTTEKTLKILENNFSITNYNNYYIDAHTDDHHNYAKKCVSEKIKNIVRRNCMSTRQ